MLSYIQVGDVNTWWDVHGEGEPLLLLHPGGAASRAYDSNALTTDDLAAISTSSLLMFADNDGEVRTEHLHAMHQALPNAQLAIVPGTGHGLLADKHDLCNRIIIDFLEETAS